MPQLLSKSEVSIATLSAMFNSFHSSMNHELFENTSVIKVATMNMDDFHYAKEVITCNH